MELEFYYVTLFRYLIFCIFLLISIFFDFLKGFFFPLACSLYKKKKKVCLFEQFEIPRKKLSVNKEELSPSWKQQEMPCQTEKIKVI